MTDVAPASAPPLISVLMTTYNGARFIAESIDSVLGQSFRDFEIVVVDDNSTDETPEILARYTDTRLRVLRNPGNLGVVGGRNRGFAELRGTYVATIDHDDLWLPTRLEAGLAVLRADPAMVMVGTQTLALHGRLRSPVMRPVETSPLLFRWMLLLDCPVVYSSLLFRRDAATRPDGTMLRPDLRYADDYELMLRLAQAGRVTALPGALTVYRLHDGNTTNRVEDEMCRHAIVAIAEYIAPWLGDDAPEAARLIAGHIARRRPFETRAALVRLSVLLRRLMDAFIASSMPAPDERARIERYTRQAYWRSVRATVRRGRISLLIGRREQHLNSMSPLGQPLDQPADLLGSITVGALRFLGRIFVRAEH